LCNNTSHICAYAALGRYLHIVPYRIWFSCTFTIFKTNYCPHGLVMSGKGKVYADEELKDGKKMTDVYVGESEYAV